MNIRTQWAQRGHPVPKYYSALHHIDLILNMGPSWRQTQKEKKRERGVSKSAKRIIFYIICRLFSMGLMGHLFWVVRVLIAFTVAKLLI